MTGPSPTIRRRFVALAGILLILAAACLGPVGMLHADEVDAGKLMAELRRFGPTPPEDAEGAYAWFAFSRDLEAHGGLLGRAMVALYQREDTSVEDRRRIMLWLDRTGYPGSRATAIKALERFGNDHLVVQKALRVLAFSGLTTDSNAVLDRLENSTSQAVRYQAARTLAFIGTLGVEPLLPKSGYDPARHAAEFIRNRFAPDRLVRQTRAALRPQPNPFSLEWVRSRDVLALPVLAELIEDDRMRAGAAALMADIDSPLVVGPLQKVLTDPQGRPRPEIVGALLPHGPITLLPVQKTISSKILTLSKTGARSPQATALLTELTALTLRSFGGADVVGRAAPAEPKQAELAMARLAQRYDRWWKNLRRNPPRDALYDRAIYLMACNQPLLAMPDDQRQQAQWRLRYFVESTLDNRLRQTLNHIADNALEDPVYRAAARRALQLKPRPRPFVSDAP